MKDIRDIKPRNSRRELTPKEKEELNFPVRPFLFTIDQIATVLNVDEVHVRQNLLFYAGRSTGVQHSHFMVARNIAAPDTKPDWRVAERELIRWMRRKGFRFYETRVSY